MLRIYAYFVAMLIVGQLYGCQTTDSQTITLAPVAKKTGQLDSRNGKRFTYTYAPATTPGTTVVYVGGLGGKGNEISTLSQKFNSAGLNLITFNRAEANCKSIPQCYKNVQRRSKNGSIMFVEENGAPSSTEDIVNNEIDAVLRFAGQTPTYDPQKGLVLIGGSYGSWLSLSTVKSFPNRNIKGVVFLSPAIAPAWVKRTPRYASIYKSLIASYGSRPGLAIGSKKDLIAPYRKDVATVSTWDSAELLTQDIGSNVQTIQVSSSQHSSVLLRNNLTVQQNIIKWITTNL